jgi:hypothetical protein
MIRFHAARSSRLGRRLAGPAVALSVLLLCALACRETADYVERASAEEVTSMTAEAFLQRLEKGQKGVLILSSPITGWPPKEELEFLASRLGDTTPSRGVMAPGAPFMPVRSTVGDEAALLLLGMKEGGYPPGGSSRKFTPQEKEALRNWASGASAAP